MSDNFGPNKTEIEALVKLAQENLRLAELDCGRWFNRALRARQEADYEALKPFSADEAKEIISQTEGFFITVKDMVA